MNRTTSRRIRGLEEVAKPQPNLVWLELFRGDDLEEAKAAAGASEGDMLFIIEYGTRRRKTD